MINREPLSFTLPDIKGQRIIVTGGNGFVGQLLLKRIKELGGMGESFDLEDGFDVLSFDQLIGRFSFFKVGAVIHLAAHKFATSAEIMPASVANLNIQGTENVARACNRYYPRQIPFVLASTCKAADPCTAYGASKLIAERVALNAGGVVIRFVNVLGSSGSVLEIWKDQDPVLYSPGLRYYITPDESVDMLLAGLTMPSGIYAPNWRRLEKISTQELALRYTHGTNKNIQGMDLRRGDREDERLIGEYEYEISPTLAQQDMMEIKGPWD